MLNLPVYTGPGLNFLEPQTRRQKIGVPQATLFAATAREKRAAAAAGAIRHRRPRMRATKTQPILLSVGALRRVKEINQPTPDCTDRDEKARRDPTEKA